MFFDHLGGLTKASVVDPAEDVVDRLGGGDDVEWGRNSSTFFKIGNPELAASKFPFSISFLLEQEILSF